MKLPPDFKAKWLTALRSGKYKQTTCYLRTRQGYCCLGVACDLHDPTTWQGPDLYHFATKNDSNTSPDSRDLPAPVFQALLQPVSAEQLVLDHLVNMNDGGAPFTAIANWIEENL